MANVELHIRPVDDRTAFAPGETMAFHLDWTLIERVDSLEVRLFWYTSGIGSRDVDIAETLPIPDPRLSDSQRVEFVAPTSPYSYSGELISILWAVELVGPKGKHAARLDITVGPEGHTVGASADEDEAA